MLLINKLFYINNLSLIMMTLVSLVALSIGSFSLRYMAGDRKRLQFFANVVLVVLSLFVMVCADHLILLFVSWAMSNWFLARLMLHKRSWLAARHSYRLALVNFAIGLAFIAAGFLFFYLGSHTLSIHVILAQHAQSPYFFVGAVCLFVGAMTQSALWPFHRWLLSSLNSPTPVSALMHAGLINGGGFLLVRFSPLLLKQTWLLPLIFSVGIITALLGTLWSLMQSDIKKMLACSTMGQMGFMVVQCGLGLFPAAISHLCWHGFFKSYLFLASGGAAVEPRFARATSPNLSTVLWSVACGSVGAGLFFGLCQRMISLHNTSLFLLVIIWVSGVQLSLSILTQTNKIRLILSLATVLLMAVIYAGSLQLIDAALLSLNIWCPQPMNALYWFGLAALVGSWAALVFWPQAAKKQPSDVLLRAYVRMLNASQPHAKTVTSHRNHYQF